MTWSYIAQCCTDTPGNKWAFNVNQAKVHSSVYTCCTCLAFQQYKEENKMQVICICKNYTTSYSQFLKSLYVHMHKCMDIHLSTHIPLPPNLHYKVMCYCKVKYFFTWWCGLPSRPKKQSSLPQLLEIN